MWLHVHVCGHGKLLGCSNGKGLLKNIGCGFFVWQSYSIATLSHDAIGNSQCIHPVINN